MPPLSPAARRAVSSKAGAGARAGARAGMGGGATPPVTSSLLSVVTSIAVYTACRPLRQGPDRAVRKAEVETLGKLPKEFLATHAIALQRVAEYAKSRPK